MKKTKKPDQFVIENRKESSKKFCGFYISKELDDRVRAVARDKKQHKRVIIEKCVEYSLDHLAK